MQTPNNNTCALSPASPASRELLRQRSARAAPAVWAPNEGRAVLRAHPAVKSAKRPQRLQVQRHRGGTSAPARCEVHKSTNKRWRKRRRLFGRARKENHKGRRRLLVIPHAHRALSTPAAHTSTRNKSTIIAIKGQLNRAIDTQPTQGTDQPLPHETQDRLALSPRSRHLLVFYRLKFHYNGRIRTQIRS